MISVFDNISSTNVVYASHLKAFKYLCDKVGITFGVPHVWNMVTLNEKYYIVLAFGEDTLKISNTSYHK